MKTKLMLVIAAVSLLVGCQTPTPDSCASAELAYGAYLIYLQSEKEPTQSQMDSATAAALFLEKYCGYEFDGVKKTVHVTKGVRVTVTQGEPRTDKWGVPIVVKP